MHGSTTSPIAYSGKTFNNETKLELLLQNNIKQGNPLHAIAEARYVTLWESRLAF